jgi:PHD/YefM family antitoxin component YafN of YafNO toxin-antitoxin module
MYHVHMTYATTSMSNARSNLAEILDNASTQLTIIRRRGKKDVALFDADIVEDVLSLQDKKLISKIAKSRSDNDLYSFEDVFGEL